MRDDEDHPMVKTVLSVQQAADGAATGAADGEGEGPALTHATKHLQQFAVKWCDQYSIAWHWVAALASRNLNSFASCAGLYASLGEQEVP